LGPWVSGDIPKHSERYRAESKDSYEVPKIQQDYRRLLNGNKGRKEDTQSKEGNEKERPRTKRDARQTSVWGMLTNQKSLQYWKASSLRREGKAFN